MEEPHETSQDHSRFVDRDAACWVGDCTGHGRADALVYVRPSTGAVIVTGSGFSRPAYDDEEPHLVVVRVRDGATGEIVTSRRVAASLPRCSPKIGCIGGGSISTGFSAAELGWARYENCELVLIDAFDEFTRRTTPALKTWLSGCIR